MTQKVLRQKIAYGCIFIVLVFLFLFDCSYCLKNRTNIDKRDSIIVIKACNLLRAQQLPLYGFNGELSKSPLWSNDSFLHSVRSLQFKAIRYPGGSVANFWDWKSGSPSSTGLPAEESTKILSSNYTSGHNLDDLKLLVNKTGCDVIFLLNMVTKSLQDQLEMLQEAEAKAIPVKWVELGNEFDFPKSLGGKKFVDAATYGRNAQEWIEKIKALFPNAQIAIIGSDKKAWNEKVIQYTTGADAIVAHLYPLPNQIIDSNEINFQRLETQITKRLSQITNEANKLPVWVTEYNIHWAYVPNENSKEVNRIRSIAFQWQQVLATVLMTSVVSSYAGRVKIILNHSLANWSNYAAVNSSSPYNLLPNGIGMKAWFAASTGMSIIQKVHLCDSNGQTLPDYKLIGWKFSKGNHSRLLITNFLPEPISLHLNKLQPVPVKFTTMHSNSNKIISSLSDISSNMDTLSHDTLLLPPFSITTIGE